MADYAIQSLFGASLCAFQNPDGGIHPIAVGSFYRRLACRMAAQHGSNCLSAELSPTQLGVSTRGGCEAAMHAFRYYSAAKAQNTRQSTHIAVKVDIKNAFNSINCLGNNPTQNPQKMPRNISNSAASLPHSHPTIHRRPQDPLRDRSPARRPLGLTSLRSWHRLNHSIPEE